MQDQKYRTVVTLQIDPNNCQLEHVVIR